MPLAGYCSECQRHVWLAADGRCENGHPASSVSGTYDAQCVPVAVQAPAPPPVPVTPRYSAPATRLHQDRPVPGVLSLIGDRLVFQPFATAYASPETWWLSDVLDAQPMATDAPDGFWVRFTGGRSAMFSVDRRTEWVTTLREHAARNAPPGSPAVPAGGMDEGTRTVLLVLGVAGIVVGLTLTLTLWGACVGVPLMILGAVLLVLSQTGR